MNQLDLERKIAYLEFVNDQLKTELDDLDQLLRQIGFPNGLASAKEVALEIIEEKGLEDKKNGEDAEDEN